MILNLLSRISLEHPKWLFAVLTVISLFFGFHARNLQVDFTLEQLFPKSDTDRDIYFAFREEFSQDDNIILMTYQTDDPFSSENLNLLRDFVDELEYLDGVEEVLSLSNIIRFTAEDDILILEDFFPEGLSSEELSRRKSDLLRHPLYSNVVISADGSVASVMVRVSDEYQSYKALRQFLAEINTLQSELPWVWRDAGVPILRTRYIQFMLQERSFFLPIATLLSALILFVMFRQRRAVILPMFAISITLIWVAGIMALFDVSVNIITYITFNLLMIVGVSNSIHILVRYYEELSEPSMHTITRDTLKRALQEVMRTMGSALFLTSLTTATGFFSLITTNITIVRQFGLILAVGVMLLFLITLLTVPSLLLFTRPPKKMKIELHLEDMRFKAARKLSEWNDSHPSIILSVTGLVIIISLLGIVQIDTNASLLEDLRAGNEVYDDIHFVERHMGNILPLEVIYNTGQNDGILELENLQRLDTLQSFLTTFPEIGSAISITDHLKLLNEILGDGTHMLPGSDGEISDFLGLYGDEPIHGLVDFAFGKGRISARIQDINANRARAIRVAIEEWGQEHLPAGQKLVVTGTTFLALKTNRYLVKNLTYSFILAFFIIFASMMILFKSPSLALLSILPNILPLLVVGGFMGLVGIKLRPTTAMTFAIAYGIAVDDTIHFLARFRREWWRNGGKYRDASRQTLLTTGKAIISTTVVLFLGFSVLFFSKFVPNYQFGLLAGLILLIAMLASITLLPVLLTLIRPKIQQ